MKPENKAKIYSMGVLTPDKHSRLLDALSAVTLRAGIQANPDYVWKSFKTGEFGEVETAYLQGFKTSAKEEGIFGYVYFEYPSYLVTKRMMEVTGLLLRNEVDARFVTRHDVLRRMRLEGDYSGSAILIPNFCIVTG